ncbi:MAG: hypothetical protein QM778_18250 [Myxococcales bacterium]
MGLGGLPTDRAHAAEPIRLPVLIHVAQEQQIDVAERIFWERQLARANEIFAPYEVAFELQKVVPARGKPRMDDRADRDALAAQLEAGVVNVFVVAALTDVDEPPRPRRGVHWHAGSPAGAHYVILSVIAEPEVLAHELGHYLGNPRHSEVPGNLMSYQRGEGLPVLDEAQQRRVRTTARAYRRWPERM